MIPTRRSKGMALIAKVTSREVVGMFRVWPRRLIVFVVARGIPLVSKVASKGLMMSSVTSRGCMGMLKEWSRRVMSVMDLRESMGKMAKVTNKGVVRMPMMEVRKSMGKMSKEMPLRVMRHRMDMEEENMCEMRMWVAWWVMTRVQKIKTSKLLSRVTESFRYDKRMLFTYKRCWVRGLVVMGMEHLLWRR